MVIFKNSFMWLYLKDENMCFFFFFFFFLVKFYYSYLIQMQENVYCNSNIQEQACANSVDSD